MGCLVNHEIAKKTTKAIRTVCKLNVPRSGFTTNIDFLLVLQTYIHVFKSIMPKAYVKPQRSSSILAYGQNLNS